MSVFPCEPGLMRIEFDKSEDLSPKYALNLLNLLPVVMVYFLCRILRNMYL
jgi:hypothetical protein